MKKHSKYAKHGRRKQSKLIIALGCVAALLLIFLIAMLLLLPGKDKDVDASETTLPDATEASAPAVQEAPVEAAVETTAPAVPEPEILPYFVDQAAANPDFAGWIKIEGTKLDYPVAYAPNEKDKYLRMDLDGDWTVGGVPFIDEDCSLDPESDNLIIYGHNMQNGTMFRTLMKYDQMNFWQEHPIIYFSTLYEERTYEIVSAFYDRVYYKYEDCFKFYQFIDAENEEDFNEAIAYFKDHDLYETGVTPEYGDRLITLVTCSYHVDNGRFVVVAREVPDAEE